MAKVLAAARLLGPGGPYALKSVTVTGADNTGWTVSASIKGGALDPSFADDTVWQVQIETSKQYLETPPMIAGKRGREQSLTAPPSGDINLVDRVGWKISQSLQSFDTFLNTTSTAVIQQLATRAGVGITGIPSWPVTEEDVKNAKLGDAIRRFCAAAALVPRVTVGGQLNCADIMNPVGSITAFRTNKRRHQVNSIRRWTGLKVEKSTRIQNKFTFVLDAEDAANGQSYRTVAFGNPLSNVTVDPRCSGCSVDQIGLWDGDPSKGSSGLIRAIGSVPTTSVREGRDPAKYASFIVIPNADAIQFGAPMTVTITFMGSPPGQLSGTQLSFSTTVGGGSRMFPEVWSEPILPNEGWVTEHGPAYLRQRNGDAETVELSGSGYLAAELGAILVDGVYPNSVLRQFSHTMDLRSALTSSLLGVVY